MPRLLVRAVVVILVLGLLGALDLWNNGRVNRRLRPPNHVQDLETFLAWMPGTLPTWEHTVGESRAIEIQGPMPRGILDIRSGPPAYVFDDAGRMIDWTLDRGDDGNFQRRWSSGRQLNDQEARSLLDGRIVERDESIEMTQPER